MLALVSEGLVVVPLELHPAILAETGREGTESGRRVTRHLASFGAARALQPCLRFRIWGYPSQKSLPHQGWQP